MPSRRAAIILAAGASQRMGTPKALLAWRGSNLIEHALQEARAALAEQIVVVLGPATRHLSLDARCVVNPAPETGRSASISLAAHALREGAAAILVQSVDQPVPGEVLDALFEAIEAGAEVAAPTFGGRRGHPVCLAGALLGELRDVDEASEGLRAVVRRHVVTEVPVESDAVLWNLNDPVAYAAALAAQ